MLGPSGAFPSRILQGWGSAWRGLSESPLDTRCQQALWVASPETGCSVANLCHASEIVQALNGERLPLLTQCAFGEEACVPFERLEGSGVLALAERGVSDVEQRALSRC